MTAKLQAKSQNLLDEDFNPEDMHPADIEQILIAAYDEYTGGAIPFKQRKKYRDKYNSLVNLLAEKRNFRQFNYLNQ